MLGIYPPLVMKADRSVPWISRNPGASSKVLDWFDFLVVGSWMPTVEKYHYLMSFLTGGSTFFHFLA